MKYIPIKNKVTECAKSFRTELKLGVTKRYQTPESRLQALHDSLVDDTDKRYVRLIIRLWDKLIVATPERFKVIINAFNLIIPTEDIESRDVKILVKNKKTFRWRKKLVTLYKEIVKAMRYDYVQSKVYPKYMQELEIKTCVYCNAQYAFAVTDNQGYTNYELDHYMPKSKYPYLCTTFMNLQPSCSSCNRRKSNKELEDDEELFQLFVKEGSRDSDSPVNFSLDNASVATYLTKQKDCSVLKIDFSCPNNAGLEKGYNHFFRISTLYQAHKDVAEELIWKNQIYNRVIIDDYKRLFKELGFKDSDFIRFILGNYELTENIHKRPLSKMTQDIARQLHIIKEEKHDGQHI